MIKFQSIINIVNTQIHKRKNRRKNTICLIFVVYTAEAVETVY